MDGRARATRYEEQTLRGVEQRRSYADITVITSHNCHASDTHTHTHTHTHHVHSPGGFVFA